MRTARSSKWTATALRHPGLGALLIALLSTGCGAGDEKAPEARPVRAVTITANETSDAITLTGRVQAQAEINQSFRLDGQLIELTVDIGDRVRQGQLIARLDSQNEQSGLQTAQAQVVAAQVQLVDARNNFNRMRDLVVDDAVARAAYDHAEAVLKTAEAQLKGAQSQLALAQNRLDFTALKADADGVVTARGAEVGEVVSAGRMIVQVAQAGARDAVFDVPAQLKDGASRNAPIEVWLTSDPNVKAKGRVRDVAPRADPVTGTFQVRIQLLNPPAAMRLGTTVTGRMRTGTVAGIEIPSSAMLRDGGRPAVWVVDPAAKTVSIRHVETSANTSAGIRVSAGLNAGDIVVTAGVQALRPGQKVRVLETAKP